MTIHALLLFHCSELLLYFYFLHEFAKCRCCISNKLYTCVKRQFGAHVFQIGIRTHMRSYTAVYGILTFYTVRKLCTFFSPSSSSKSKQMEPKTIRLNVNISFYWNRINLKKLNKNEFF